MFDKSSVCVSKVYLNSTGLECLHRIQEHYKFYDDIKVNNSDIFNVALIYLDEHLRTNAKAKRKSKGV